MSILGVHHIAIQVRDLERSRTFYVDVLGLQERRRQAHAIWVGRDQTIIMLERAPPDTVAGTGDLPSTVWASPSPGLFVLAFGVTPDGRLEVERRLAAAGVDVDHRTGFTSYFYDPDGTRLAISHYPENPVKG